MKKLIPTLTLTALLGSFLQAEPENRPDGPQKDAPRIERPDWDSLKKRIEGAVERGDLTREQANQKYAEIKKKMVLRRPGAQSDRPLMRPDVKPGTPPRKTPMGTRPMRNDGPPDALGQILASLVGQGKLNRMEAARIRQAALTGRPPGPPHGGPKQNDHHGPAPREDLGHMREEMHGLLEAARQELAQVREIRMNLEEARRHHEQEMAERRLMAQQREMEERREAMERERHEMEKHREAMEHEKNERRGNIAKEQAENRRREEIARDEARRTAEEAKRRAMEERRKLEQEREKTETRGRETREAPPWKRGDREE